MITGYVEFYDERSAWGLIRSDDGRLYDLRGAQLAGPPPRVGDRMMFEPQGPPGAPRAVNVKRIKAATAVARGAAPEADGAAAHARAPRPPHSPSGPRLG